MVDVKKICKIKKLEWKLVKNESNIEFLDKCVEANITSKGFKIKWRPAYQADEEESDNISRILESSSHELMTNVLQHYKGRRILLLQQANREWDEVEDNFPKENVTCLKQQIRKDIRAFQHKLSQVKTKKLDQLTKQVPVGDNALKPQSSKTSSETNQHDEDQITEIA